MTLTIKDQTIRFKDKTIRTNHQTLARQYPVKEIKIKADKYKIPLAMVNCHPTCKRSNPIQINNRSQAITDTVQAQTIANST